MNNPLTNRYFFAAHYYISEEGALTFTRITREFCYPCWTFTVKLYNFGCSYCVVTGCTQDRKEAQLSRMVLLVKEVNFSLWIILCLFVIILPAGVEYKV